MTYKPKYEPDDYIIREKNGYIAAYKIVKIVEEHIETKDGLQKLLFLQYKMNLLYSVSGGIDYDVYNDVVFMSCESIDNNKIFSHINKDEKPVKLPVANQLYSLKGTEGQSIVIVISVNENNVTYRSLKDSESTKTKPSILFFHFFEEYNESSETRSKPDQTHGKR